MANEIGRLPLDYLSRLGTVSNSRTNVELDPFSATEPFPVEPNLFEEECPECGELFAGDECEWCAHEECRDGQMCEDCLGNAIDRAHDSMDMER